MSGNAWISIIFVLAALILPLSALRSRHISKERLLWMGAAWIGLFVIVALFISAIR